MTDLGARGTWQLLDCLNPAEQAAVVSAAHVRSYAEGDVIFHEGDVADSVHLVVSGHVAVTVSTEAGERATLAVLGAGAWFGELSQLREQVPMSRSATVRALDDTETLMLTQAAFQRMCVRHPSVERLVAILMAARIRGLSSLLLRALYAGLTGRVVLCLLELADAYGEGSERTVIPLTQDQLADIAGGSRPSVNQILQRLVADGLVELGRGRIVLVDRDALERVLAV